MPDETTPRRILLDCDPGHDDAVAMLLAHGSPDVELLAVTTVAGNASLEKVTHNALVTATVGGIRDVPFAAGAARPLLREARVAGDIHGESGLDGPVLPAPEVALDPRHGVDLIIDTVLHHPAGTVTLVPTGPLTNIALAARKEPRIVERVAEVVLMGGAYGPGNRTPVSEFNIGCDPEGLTDGVRAFADDVRQVGHTVHTPDLFDGRSFDSIEDGFAYARSVGLDTIGERGLAAANDLPAEVVYAGFSFGVTIAQRLAQTRPGARGALLIYSCLPVSEFGEAWPVGVPVQVHGKAGDEFFDEDLPAARELAESTPTADLFLYPGDQHLFADASLAAYDPEAAALLMERVRTFLASV